MRRFKWHFLTAFLTLVMIEIFEGRLQPNIRTLIELLIGSVLLGICLIISEWLIDHFTDGVFKGLKGIKDLLLGKK